VLMLTVFLAWGKALTLLTAPHCLALSYTPQMVLWTSPSCAGQSVLFGMFLVRGGKTVPFLTVCRLAEELPGGPEALTAASKEVV
jgi:hypothetical protein